jgi:hypothetical protein
MNIIQIIGIVLLILWVWIVYEIWRAPIVKEDSNGKWIELEPTKKFSDLFKKIKK